MLGCLGIVAAFFFSITLIVMLFAPGASWSDRFAVSAMMAAMPVTAIALLAWRDKAAFHRTKRKVMRQLMQRSDVSDSEFCAPFPHQDPRPLLDVRNAIAAFFGVPSSKIHPTDDLIDDVAWRALSPSILCFTTYRVLEVCKVSVPSHRVSGFPRSNRIDGLAEEMQQLMQWMRNLEAEQPDE
jgi:hypothetical protein